MINRVTALAAFLLIVSLPLFLHIDRWPFRLWDESRLAANAFEMHKNGNVIVTHYDDQPEMWNTKPPLMIWLQVASIKLLGFNELAVRLPAALCGLLTCLLLLFFSKRLTGEYLTGILASVALVTTNGYIDAHAIRTGDYDGVLALFTTTFVLSAFMFTEQHEKKWINWFLVGIVLAVLTKSIQALVFLPGIFLYFLLKRKIAIIPARRFFIGSAIAVLLICSYYITREIVNPGYIGAIWENELGGRYFNALEENAAGPTYYAEWMYNHIYTYWIWFLPFAFVAGFLSRHPAIKNFTLYNLIIIACYFGIISLAKTKLYWYTLPILPLLSLQIAVLLREVYLLILAKSDKRAFKYIAGFAILSIVFAYPYLRTIKKVYNPHEYEWDKNIYSISYLLQDALQGRASVNNHVIVYTDFDQHLRIYAKALLDKGQAVIFKTIQELENGDTVIASEETVISELKKLDGTIIKSDDGYIIYQIK